MKQETGLHCSFSCSQYRTVIDVIVISFCFQLLNLLALLSSCRSELRALEKSEDARQYSLHDDISGPG